MEKTSFGDILFLERYSPKEGLPETLSVLNRTLGVFPAYVLARPNGSPLLCLMWRDGRAVLYEIGQSDRLGAGLVAFRAYPSSMDALEGMENFVSGDFRDERLFLVSADRSRRVELPPHSSPEELMMKLQLEGWI